jgi:predicted Zn-dependent protease
MKRTIHWYLIVVLFAVSCQSRDGDYTLFTEEEDKELGARFAQQIERDPDQFPMLDRGTYSGLYGGLETMRDRILESGYILHRDEFAWKLHVIDNDSIYNAFCTPGGYIYIYTGLIRFVASADELAGILAHEIAHADLRHSTDQMTKTYGVRILASILTGGDAEILTQLGLNLLGLSFSRSDEEEADLMAVQYLSDTDYNPRAFTAFFKRLEARGETMGPLQFLSTHPNPENRIEKINEAWRNAGSGKGKDHSAEFRKLKDGLPS